MLSSLFARRRRTVARMSPAPSFFRPQLEGFEDRVVPAAPFLGAGHFAPANLTIAPTFNFSALQLNVQDVQILSNNTLGAVFQIGNVTNIVPITLGTSPNPADADCPILNLELGPIHLDLLGLNVDTSRICLDIIAHQGEGLLGDLLCGVANLLDGGVPLGDILAGGVTNPLTGDLIDPAALTGALTDILNGVLDQIAAQNLATVTGVSGSTTNILNLAIGPVNLNLLGLEVALDNCEGGPVTVDITAESGPGRLLGNLLGNLSRLLDSPANSRAIANALDRIADQIGRIVDLNS
jgi:hypothetical protein